MRVAIIGTAAVGKSQVLKDFLANWPKYTTPTKTYRDVLQEKGLGHSKKTCKATQQAILDWMIEEEKKHRKGDKVVYDRCTLDNLVYSMWAYEHGETDIDKTFVDQCIPLVRESLRSVDIIFFIPLSRFTKINNEDDKGGKRETDPVFIREIDNLFKAFAAEWHKPASPFFARDDKPAIIEIFGSPQERMKIIELYLDKDGDEIGDGKLIDPNEIARLSREFGIQPGSAINPKSLRI